MKLLVPLLHAWRTGLLLSTLLGLLLLPQFAGAQQAFLQQFGPAEGLRPPFVYALLQDRQGYLWLGTNEGLVRYDGMSFVTFTKKDGLAENGVVSLREDRSTGQLWVGHYGGGVSVKKEALGSFAPAGRAQARLGGAKGPPPVDTTSIGKYLRRYRLRLPTGVVPICLLEDRYGNTWLGTAGQGLWRHSDRHLRRYPTPSGSSPPLALGTGPQGVLAVGTAAGLQLVTPNGTLGKPVSSQLAKPIRALLPRPGIGRGYWVGTAGDGVWQYTPPQAPRRLGRLPDSLAVTALTYAAGSGLWVGTANDGLYLLPADSALPVRHFTTAQGLLQNTIHALLADRSGRIWIGTQGTRLAAYNPTTELFTFYRLNNSALCVSSFATDANGRVWVGTEGQGLYCLTDKTWLHYDTRPSPSANYVYGLLPLPALSKAADAGKWLLISHLQGLTLLDVGTGRLIPLVAATDTLVRDCRGPLALTTGTRPAVWAATQGSLVRLDLPEILSRPWEQAPGLMMKSAEVDGAPQPVASLGELSPTRHRLRFTFEGVSLAVSNAPLEYQYRLLGLSDAWSSPSTSPEMQFPGLDAGRYRLEVRARRGLASPWSAVVPTGFAIATPFWRTRWFSALVLLGLASIVFGVVWVRERTLRHTQLVLERTVEERTAELRQQKAHIENINADLVVARDAAEASRRAKAQFLANMSHEIRTPMNAVIGLTNLLQATRPTPEQREYLTAIESSSQNLLVIINDILDISKMEAGKLSLEHVPFRLPEAVRHLAALFKFAIESKGLSFLVNVADDVPAAVLGDPVRLNQILVNLVGNAIKFTREGAVTVTVEVVPASSSAPLPLTHSRVRFAVHDTGIGIPTDKLGVIFEDFSQANTSTTREFGGTGLGLSIARNLVQLHGGQLHVTSQEGVGSEFFFELIYEIADPSVARPETRGGQLAPFEPALRVLVAEDNTLNQLVARKTLEAWNVQVVVAENGRRAVQAAISAPQPFDAVLMDVQMPDMDGYEAARQLRQHFPDATRFPIIGLTASILPEDRLLALAAGMNDTLTKPFEPAVLYTRLAHFTRRAAPTDPPPPHTPEQAAPGAAVASPLSTAVEPDWQLLEELSGGNESFLRQIVGTFLTEAPTLEALLATTCSSDLAALASTAHKLKGQVAYFGVPDLHTRLGELEGAARQPERSHCEPLVNSIRQQLAELYPHLAARIGS
ncbi:response regulator [Hymenobacter sp. BT664]|uniref:Sensory/regulatory protein RpfC n=1 Tax=Hymenobacter montanus TaxID=2771359 RepID=A0A927BGC5_9BACT|nr:hybrid sensor histidine kinase/response regulator [Hymenobacter montanus]MBD2770377.1 response regulator [Hymenobacter montanus]